MNQKQFYIRFHLKMREEKVPFFAGIGCLRGTIVPRERLGILFFWKNWIELDWVLKLKTKKEVCVNPTHTAQSNIILSFFLVRKSFYFFPKFIYIRLILFLIILFLSIYKIWFFLFGKIWQFLIFYYAILIIIKWSDII